MNKNNGYSAASSKNIQAARSNRRKSSLAAAVAGVSTAAILLSSGTVALWQDAVRMDGGNITAGNIDVEKLGTLDWFENSNDVASKGSLIDLTSYKTTPGDSLLGKQKLDIGLEGDNLYATANVTFPTLPSGELYATPEGVKLTYVVVDRDGNEVTAETPVGQTSAAWNVNPSHVSGKIVDNTVDYVVQIKAVFDKNTSARVRTQTQAMLGKLQFNIQQVRSPIAAASTVTKTLSSPTIKAGDEITVTYTVNNIGAEVLNNVTIDDPLLEAAGVDLSSAKIAPGGSHTFTAKIKVTKELSQQDELFNGGVTSTGVAESGEVTSTGSVNNQSNVVAYSADMSIVGSAKINDLNGNGALDYNETVTYSWVVKNTGYDTIKNVNVVAKGSPTSTETGDMASGVTRTFTATYSPTGDDLLSILNVSATAHSAAALDNTPLSVTSTPVSVNTIKPTPGATFTPTATLSTDKNNDGVANVGDAITFTAKFTNTGNVPLNDVKLSSSLSGVDWDKTTVTTVAPGETITFTGTKTLTAADLATGAVNNDFKIDYVPAASSGSLVDTTKTGSTLTAAYLNSSVNITSNATIENDSDNIGVVDPGEKIVYNWVVRNTGDDDINNINIVTNKNGLTPSSDKKSLHPGEDTVFSANYTPTDQDYASGSIEITSSATATSSTGKQISSNNSTTVLPAVDPTPSGTITRNAVITSDANSNGTLDAGDVARVTLTYTSTAKTKSVLVPSANKTITWNPTTATVSPGDTATFVGTYTAVAADATGMPLDLKPAVTATGSNGSNITLTTNTALPTTVPASGGMYEGSSYNGNWQNITSIDKPYLGAGAYGTGDPYGNIYFGVGAFNPYPNNVPQPGWYKYAPSTNTWTQMANQTRPRSAAGAIADSKGRIFVFGGQSNGTTPLSTVDMYDPKTNTWTAKRAMSIARVNPNVFMDADGMIYIAGGRNGTATNGASLATVEKYNPNTDTYTTAPPLAKAVENSGKTRDSKGRFWLFSGYSYAGNMKVTSSDQIQMFDPAKPSDGWVIKEYTNMGAPPYTIPTWADNKGRIYYYPTTSQGASIYDTNTNKWVATSTTNKLPGNVSEPVTVITPDSSVWIASTYSNGSLYKLEPDS